MTKAILGLDVGTSTTKAVLFDANGTELGRAVSPPCRTFTPRPGWVEQDPEELWQAVVSAVRLAIDQAGPDVDVLALCMAAQSGSLLPADITGKPLRSLITWMDGRTEELVRRWQAEGIQEQVRALSGWSLYPGLCLPTIAWLRQHDPDTFAAARRYLSVNDFIAHRLTGRFSTNPSNAGGMQLVDIRTGQWSEPLCALAGITPDRLSPIRPAGAIIGEIMPAVFDAAGLSAGTVLVNGGHDQGCSALGLGVTAPGEFLLACGTAWVITGVTSYPDMSHIPDAVDVNFHPVPDLRTISRSLGGLGASLEWWVHQAWQGVDGQMSRQQAYASLDEELAQTKPGGGGPCFLPLTGGHDDPATTKRGAFVDLQLSHNRADMARATLESAAFELRWALEDIVQAGLPVKQMWMVGGAAQSSCWPSILADVTGVPLRRPLYDNWPALGAAVLAGVGSSLFETIEDGLERFERPAQDIVPNEALKTRYDAAFRRYQEHVRNMGRRREQGQEDRN